jgi:hypothetical protein
MTLILTSPIPENSASAFSASRSAFSSVESLISSGSLHHYYLDSRRIVPFSPSIKLSHMPGWRARRSGHATRWPTVYRIRAILGEWSANLPLSVKVHVARYRGVMRLSGRRARSSYPQSDRRRRKSIRRDILKQVSRKKLISLPAAFGRWIILAGGIYEESPCRRSARR